MEVTVFIHGIVGRTYGPHTDDYRAFHEGLSDAGVSLPPFEAAANVEWGWPTPVAGDSDQLALAQVQLGATIEAADRKDTLPRRFLKPLRDLVFYGWSDIAYYLDDGGKANVRKVVWTSIMRHFPTDVPVNITLVGHSAGALIAHDFLFFLFSGMRDERRLHYAPDSNWDEAAENWRIRRLVTLGSPFTPLLVRSADLVKKISAGPGPWLDPAVIGFDREPHGGGRPLWLNVWDVHDILSYPAEGAYATDRVMDLFPDHSDRPTKAHNRYWTSGKVHRAIAAAWDR